MDGTISLKVIEDDPEDWICEVTKPDYQDEMGLSEVELLLGREIGLDERTVSFVMDYLHNFKEVVINPDKTFYHPR